MLWNIYPRKDAGVIGVPDEDFGELPRAFVVKAPGSNVTGELVIILIWSILQHFQEHYKAISVRMKQTPYLDGQASEMLSRRLLTSIGGEEKWTSVEKPSESRTLTAQSAQGSP